MPGRPASQPLWPDSSATPMPGSQPSKVMLSLLEMSPCSSLGGAHFLLPFQVHEGSVFSLSKLSKAPHTHTHSLRNPASFIQALWLLQHNSPLFNQLLYSMQETLRQRNWKGQAVGLEHKVWGIDGGKKSKMHSYVKNRFCHKHTPTSFNRV